MVCFLATFHLGISFYLSDMSTYNSLVYDISLQFPYTRLKFRTPLVHKLENLVHSCDLLRAPRLSEFTWKCFTGHSNTGLQLHRPHEAVESSLSKRCCPVNHLWNKKWLNSCAAVQKDTTSVLGTDLVLQTPGFTGSQSSPLSSSVWKICGFRKDHPPDSESDLTALRMRKSSPARDDRKSSVGQQFGKCPAGVLRFSCNSDAFRVELTLSLHTMNFASDLVLLTVLCKCLIRRHDTVTANVVWRTLFANATINSFNCASNETLILCSGDEQMYGHKYDGHIKVWLHCGLQIEHKEVLQLNA